MPARRQRGRGVTGARNIPPDPHPPRRCGQGTAAPSRGAGTGQPPPPLPTSLQAAPEDPEASRCQQPPFPMWHRASMGGGGRALQACPRRSTEAAVRPRPLRAGQMYQWHQDTSSEHELGLLSVHPVAPTSAWRRKDHSTCSTCKGRCTVLLPGELRRPRTSVHSALNSWVWGPLQVKHTVGAQESTSTGATAVLRDSGVVRGSA